ncbi:hypothetical protein BJ912DRAFT_964844 [Pholiota molesta]|nr:hypothetical protein BJ912DRAFT_964844 [Pholiota molesta]
MDNTPIEKEKLLISSPEISSESLDGNSEELPTKDGEYWILGDFVVFQAENVLFRVPSAQFIQNSDFFATMFNLPQGGENGDSDEREGKSSRRPIILPTIITAFDFRSLLKALYPQKYVVASKQIPSGLNKEELTSILKLSTMWYFLDHRAQAIDKLSSLLYAAEKVVIGRKYKVLKLLRAGFETLITRYDPIEDDDAILVEPMTAVRLYRAREKYKGNGNRTQWQAREFDALLAERFGAELEAIGIEEMGYTASKNSQM